MSQKKIDILIGVALVLTLVFFGVFYAVRQSIFDKLDAESATQTTISQIQ